VTAAGYVEHDARVGDLRLHYQEWGDAKAPTLLLVHGFGVSGHMFDEFAQPAAQLVEPVTGMRRDEHRTGQRAPQLSQRQVRRRVGLVDHQQLWRGGGVMVVLHFADDLTDRLDLCHRVDIGPVDDMHQQIGPKICCDSRERHVSPSPALHSQLAHRKVRSTWTLRA